MSRAAFIDALTGDAGLNNLGLDDESIFHNWSSEERPTSTGPFIILRYGPTNRPMFNGELKSPERVTLWVHIPLQITNDYTEIIEILDRVDTVLKELRDTPGSDGYTLSFVDIGGRSGDLVDDGFGTITKNADYELHSTKS